MIKAIKYILILLSGMYTIQVNGQNSLFISKAGEESYHSAYDSLLSKYQISYTDHWIDTDLGTIHLLEVGNRQAPAVLLLPAAGCSAAGWYANLNELGKKYHVYALDIPGDAGKSSLSSPYQSIDDYTSAILTILDSLKLAKVSLVGHSIGGFLSTGFAMRYPERVEKLVLVSPVATHTKIHWYFKILLQMGGKPGKGPSADNTLKMQAGKDFVPEPAFVSLMQCVRDYCNVDIIFPYVYPENELEKLNVPTYLIIGDQEKLCSYKKSVKDAHKKISGIKFEIMLGTGHTPNMENPAQFNELILNIL
jgi:pimeloyl-ACP methyl ester carboxylesterase